MLHLPTRTVGSTADADLIFRGCTPVSRGDHQAGGGGTTILAALRGGEIRLIQVPGRGGEVTLVQVAGTSRGWGVNDGLDLQQV